jgi:CHAT domain-containing protein/tetratricopeptide (TPR) repeat protein
MAQQNDFLDVIAQNTIAVMTAVPERKGEWFDSVRQLATQAQQAGDQNAEMLLDAISKLVMEEKPENIPQLNMEGPHASCWQRILEGLSNPSKPDPQYIQVITDGIPPQMRQLRDALPEQYRDPFWEIVQSVHSQEEFYAALEGDLSLKNAVEITIQNLRRQNAFRQLVFQFLQASSLQESRMILEEHPDLLSNQTEQELGELITAFQVKQDENARQSVTQHLAFLRRCREIGIKLAFWEKSHAESNNGETSTIIPIGFEEDMQQLIDLNSQIRSNPGLLPQKIALVKSMLSRLVEGQSPLFRGLLLNHLGLAYSELSTGDRGENLQNAITWYRKALVFRTFEAFPFQYADTQNNLGNAYSNLPIGDPGSNLQTAIDCYQEALRVCTPVTAPSNYATIMTNLGNAYKELPTGDHNANLKLAIKCYQEALRFRIPDIAPFQYAATQNNLGLAYSDLLTGDRRANLETAIECFQEALRFYTPDATPFDYAGVQNNLGKVYSSMHSGNRDANLQVAIAHFKKALTIYTPAAFPYRYATVQLNLGSAYSELSTGDRGENLQTAIECCQQALRFHTPEASPFEYAGAQNNLGLAYLDLPTGNREANLQQAIACFREALRFYTSEAFPLNYAHTQINIGNAYWKLPTGNQETNLQTAIVYYREALTIFTPETVPQECRRTAWILGMIFGSLGDWIESIQAYQMAVKADQILFQAAIYNSSKRSELSEGRNLYIGAAIAYVKAGLPAQAVEMLETVRSRQMREVLESTQQDLENLKEHGYGELYDRYQQASADFRAAIQAVDQQASGAETSQNVWAQNRLETLTRLQQQEQEAITAIRQVEDYKDFMLSLSAKMIQEVGADLPLVYLVAGADEGLALLVTGTEIIPIWLEKLSDATLSDTFLGPEYELGGYLADYLDWRSNLQDEVAHKAWAYKVEQITGWLWNAGMGSIIEQLKKQNIKSVVLIPSGLLGLLPLHATWTDDSSHPTGKRYALDDICFSYAPSAHTLRHVRLKVQLPFNSFLGIDTLTDEYISNQVVDEVRLWFSEQTIKHLTKNEVQLELLKDYLPIYNILHFATHGIAGFDDPLHDSILTLYKPPHLSLADIMKLDLHSARLAVLAACESSIPGDFEIIDEVVSLPTGFLQAGVPGIVGSLWLANDWSTLLLMRKFYELWLAQNVYPTEALRQAQIWLRDTTNADWLSYFQTRNEEPFLSFFKDMNDLGYEQERYFSHPLYWAAFGFTGL